MKRFRGPFYKRLNGQIQLIMSTQMKRIVLQFDDDDDGHSNDSDSVYFDSRIKVSDSRSSEDEDEMFEEVNTIVESEEKVEVFEESKADHAKCSEEENS